MSNPTEQTVSPDLDAMMRQWRDVTVENFAWMTGQAVSSEAFTKSSKAMMDLYLLQAKKLRELTGQSLDAMEIPKRSDLARLSTQVLGVEGRVANLEDQLDRVERHLREMKSMMEALTASVTTLQTLENEGELRHDPEGETAVENEDRPDGGATKKIIRRK